MVKNNSGDVNNTEKAYKIENKIPSGPFTNSITVTE